MKWIELHQRSGEAVMVNTDTVSCIANRKGGSDIYFVGDAADFVSVKESCEEVKAMLTGEKPAEQPDIDEAKRIAFRTGYEAGVKETTKHSQWIVDRYGDCTCKSCGCGNICKTNYCPECGADMRKETEKHEVD